MTRRMQLRCPYCHRVQAYYPRAKTSLQRGKTGADFVGKKRKCVNCNKLFPVYYDAMNHNMLSIEYDVKAR